MTISGVHVTVAVGLLAAIGDISRFASPEKLVSYLGLNPSGRQSGNGPAYLVPGGDVMATKVRPADRELIAVHERAIRRHLLDAALGPPAPPRAPRVAPAHAK